MATKTKIKNLIIVESPTKAKTITGFLPAQDFTIESSQGHVRDLPKSRLGIDLEKNFSPEYIIPMKKKKMVNELKKKSLKAENIYLASDEDREGEAIAWHLQYILTKDDKAGKVSPEKIQRIAFHEITEEAVKNAISHSRAIDQNLVDAQQARRILDRLVGYTLSPILWEKIAKKLSAGRVQSPALRLILEREQEIKKFQPLKYWSLHGLFSGQDDPEKFEADLIKIKDQSIKKPGLLEESFVQKIIDDLKNDQFSVSSIEQKETIKNPLSPFTTSTLQQEANNKLGFSAKKTMVLAQQLYEGIPLEEHKQIGLITYLRTDSVTLAEKFLNEAEIFIQNNFSKKYLNRKQYQTKSKGAQEAHEAIRPTSIDRTPETIGSYLNADQAKLYGLIWKRTIASQMAAAVLQNKSIDIKNNDYLFRVSGSTIGFDGWLKIYPEKQNENILPNLKKDEPLTVHKIYALGHQTEPPARFTEASLIKMLESLGIGRPSTYVPIIETLKNRNYVLKNGKQLEPTEIGEAVNKLLTENFQEIVDYDFTAKMEEKLDRVAEGETNWHLILENFFVPFKQHVQDRKEKIQKIFIDQTSKEICPNCGKNLLIKMSRFGRFLACPGFPECRYIKSLTEKKNQTGISCPKCQTGTIIKKKSKRGRFFYACSEWPKCDFALWDEPINEKCPLCQSLLVKRGKKVQCSQKGCGYKRSEQPSDSEDDD